MTDLEVCNKHDNTWNEICNINESYLIVHWRDYIQTIQTTDLIQMVRFIISTDIEINELKTRQIPQELKLEVLLLVGDKSR